jgi:dipeptidyl aminopeptidase/acylaminoacyl peptidase
MHFRPLSNCILAGFAVSCTSLVAAAQSGSPAPMQSIGQHDVRLQKVMESMNQAKTPDWAAISPDGSTIAWTMKRDEGTQIHLTEIATPSSERILQVGPRSDCKSETPVWSPDGSSLAFASTCTPSSEKADQEQIFIWSKATGINQQLTHLTGNIDSLAWSPDGKSIAFLFVENATRSAGALAAMKPWSGVIGEDGVEVQRIYDVDVASGTGFWRTPANRHVYEFDWSPTSDGTAYVAADPPGENNWWVAKLRVQSPCTLPPGTGLNGSFVVNGNGCGPFGNDRIALDPATIPGPLHNLQIAVPRFSPDGSKIAFIGGIMSDQGSTGGDVWVVPSKGGPPKDITPNIDGTPTFLAWLNNNRIGLVEERRGRIRLPDFDVASATEIPGSADDLGEVTLSGGPIKDAVSFTFAHQQGLFALIKSDFQSPPEVYVGPGSNLKQLTHLNDGIKASWGKSESIEWDNEGFHNQGWLLYPADYDPSKKYPLIVQVHGGPSASIGSSWGGGGALYSAMGYFVFSPNPRGSFGQGERFTQANVKDFGYGDLRDILKGMDKLEATLPIDTHREGLTGWSYGGFMTMFGVTQTNRFKAAVAGAGISDWKSYYGENSIDQWMLPFFGATVYDDPAVYAKSSAIEYIKNVKTPTLVIVGDRDGECPAPQSFEFWHALRAEGVKTQLVVYPNEGHHFVDAEHIRDRDERMLDWFAKQMP